MSIALESSLLAQTPGVDPFPTRPGSAQRLPSQNPAEVWNASQNPRSPQNQGGRSVMPTAGAEVPGHAGAVIRAQSSNRLNGNVGTADWNGTSGSPVVPASATQGIPSDSSPMAADAASPVPGEGTPLSVSSGDSSKDKKTSGGVFGALVSIGSSFVIVMALFLGIAWFYRKTLSTTMGASLPKQVVDVLGRSTVAARQQLVLVRFGSKLVLVSIAQGETRMISEITDPVEVDKLTGQCESSKPGSSVQSFRSVFAQGGRSR